MRNVYKEAIIGGITGALLYICWYILPSIKKGLVQKGERKLKKHGLYDYYKMFYKIVKTLLYILLVLMILAPIVFFIVVSAS